MEEELQNSSSRGISSSEYIEAEEKLRRKFEETLIPGTELLEQTSLFVTPQHKRRELFWYEIYKLINDKPGSIAQFGVRWGREIANFETLRTIFEPFNHSRKIFGFDTFSGYPETANAEKNSLLSEGNLSVTDGYDDYLEDLLRTRERLSPLPQAKKFELVKGKVEDTLPLFLENNPHQVFALVHFDLNLGSATRFAMEQIKPRLFKGSIVVLDEICHSQFPGETTALMENFDLSELALKRLPFINTTWQTYFEVG